MIPRKPAVVSSHQSLPVCRISEAL
uniref:Oxysterol binding protein n=1 Tax=Rhizophora mucronata TaxID=61149 RepID=A0A2P2LDM7_RHIMU